MFSDSFPGECEERKKYSQTTHIDYCPKERLVQNNSCCLEAWESPDVV